MSKPNFTLNFTSSVIDKQVLEYVRTVGMREEEILLNLRKESEILLDKASIMISTPEQTQLLKLLIKFSNVKSILEIGTLTGYSTLAFALCDSNIKITTLDINEKWTELGRKYWKLANVENQIHSIIKPALQSLQELKEEELQFDLIYIDADKENQLKYIDYAHDLLRRNGLLIIDNVLWGGQVVYNEFKNTPCEFIKEMNLKLHLDQRFELAMTTIGDGATFLLKK